MKKNYFCILIVFFQLSLLLAQSDGWDAQTMTTLTLDIKLSNSGVLDWYSTNTAIYNNNFPTDYNGIIFNHTIELTAYRNGNLIGVVNNYLIDYSPGPIINDSAAMEVTPQNVNDYRVYHIDQSSAEGDPDYDEWPIQWGAPHDENGNPKVYGTQTAFSVYNDAHLGDDYRGFPYTQPNLLQVSETVWSYEDNPLFDNTVFFRYRFINKDSVDYNNAIVSLWSDVDIANPLFNWGGYNSAMNFMFCYYYMNLDTIPSPRVAAYVLLQGPLVPEDGSVGKAFEQSYEDCTNLNVTAGWYIFDDGIHGPGLFGADPATLQDARYLAEGLMMSGEPMINPLTGDTTTYSFDGDPATGEGWLWDLAIAQGGSGIISSSGPFNLPAGDSTEVIYALVMTEGVTYQNGFQVLYENVPQIYDYWNSHGLSIINDTKINPNEYSLFRAYPNPFNNSIHIDFFSNKGLNKIVIYDLLGDIVYQRDILGIETKENSIQWSPNNTLSCGIYLIKISNDKLENVKKITYLK